MALKFALLAILAISILHASNAATSLQTWCYSHGKNATYTAQRCFTIGQNDTYSNQIVSGCNEKSNGRLAILPSTNIVSKVQTNLTQQFGSERFHIGIRQKFASNNSVTSNFFWSDIFNNTYGINADITWNSASGEPNDLPTAGENNEEDCCDVKGNTGKIYDSACNRAMRAICEYREPVFSYAPVHIGFAVNSSSTALIQGKTSISIANLNLCSMMCRPYLSCFGFVINKSTMTCSLLFKNSLPATDLISNSASTVYGLQ